MMISSLCMIAGGAASSVSPIAESHPTPVVGGGGEISIPSSAQGVQSVELAGGGEVRLPAGVLQAGQTSVSIQPSAGKTFLSGSWWAYNPPSSVDQDPFATFSSSTFTPSYPPGESRIVMTFNYAEGGGETIDWYVDNQGGL